MDEAKIHSGRQYSKVSNTRRSIPDARHSSLDEISDLECTCARSTRATARKVKTGTYLRPKRDDDVGAAEQLIDLLGGCRPRLTSPPGALLLQLHFLTHLMHPTAGGEGLDDTISASRTDRFNCDRD